MHIINVGYDSTNYYVLATGRSHLLIDVGWPGTLPRLRHQLRVKGLALEDLTHLLITHYHPDHAGLVQEVRAHGARLIVAEAQLPAIPKLRQYMKPAHPYQEIVLDDVIVLHPDESRAFLHGLGIEGEIIGTPGHSDDSITLILDDGIAFTGDLPGPMAAPDGVRETVARSWASIQARNVQRIYPGHGPVRPLADAIA